MSYKYRLKGARWLRLYTAAARSPAYAAQSDAQTIADTLCDVPWTRAKSDGPAMFPLTSAKALDENPANRDLFDAALFCAEHADGAHRAYANAAMYLFELPAAAQGKTLESVKVHVESDAYNALGARIAVHLLTSATLPTDCATVRTGDAYAAGAVPRRIVPRAGTNYWYSDGGDVTIAGDEGAAIGTTTAYLAMFVGLENYATSRGEWLEGASYIRNAIEIATTEEITADGWESGSSEIVDCIAQDEEPAPVPVVIEEGDTLPVVADGVLPRLMGETSGIFATVRRGNGDGVAFEDTPPEETGADGGMGLHALYADLLLGRMESVPTGKVPGSARPGVGFAITRGTMPVPGGAQGTDVVAPAWRLALSVLVVPFVRPGGRFSSLSLAWTAPSPASGTIRAYLAPGKYIEKPEASELSAAAFFTGDDPPDGWRPLGEFAASAESATLALPAPPPVPQLATLLLAAWLPQAAVDPSSSAAQGVGALAYDPFTGELSGLTSLIVPTISLV